MIKLTRSIIISALLFTLALGATGCGTLTENAEDTTKNVIKEVNDAYGNVRETVDETKTWVNTKVNQAEQATEDVQEAAESLNNAVNSLREFTSLGGKNKENTGENEQTTTTGNQTDQPSGEGEQ